MLSTRVWCCALVLLLVLALCAEAKDLLKVQKKKRPAAALGAQLADAPRPPMRFRSKYPKTMLKSAGSALKELKPRTVRSVKRGLQRAQADWQAIPQLRSKNRVPEAF